MNINTKLLMSINYFLLGNIFFILQNYYLLKTVTKYYHK